MVAGLILFCCLRVFLIVFFEKDGENMKSLSEFLSMSRFQQARIFAVRQQVNGSAKWWRHSTLTRTAQDQFGDSFGKRLRQGTRFSVRWSISCSGLWDRGRQARQIQMGFPLWVCLGQQRFVPAAVVGKLPLTLRQSPRMLRQVGARCLPVQINESIGCVPFHYGR